MGRNKLPSNVKKLKNTYRKHRENPNEPEPTSQLGSAPDFLNDEQKAIWDELSSIAHAGVLSEADRIVVEIATRLLTELRSKGKLPTGQMSHLILCLGKMGMNPAERSKVSTPDKGKEYNPWDDV